MTRLAAAAAVRTADAAAGTLFSATAAATAAAELAAVLMQVLHVGDILRQVTHHVARNLSHTTPPIPLQLEYFHSKGIMVCSQQTKRDVINVTISSEPIGSTDTPGHMHSHMHYSVNMV